MFLSAKDFWFLIEIERKREIIFNNSNRSLLFNGNLLHSGATKIHNPSVYFVAAFN